ncbi:AP-1 complex subunit gamma-2 [Porphyridium purpureum]|uniref:AP-1 complex subunit gamma-2 n=1 Tax=Porphyridium purpureum TaxID=35688 RepID=A0A5J4Z694_PORPP|nr:AP-1 complex subunit gamma-2 [Porphyridium purpureum]|eukprot:POR1906..scf295_1
MEKEARKVYKKTREAYNKAKRTYVCRSLKDCIKAYRECKTVEEERAFVKKESAHIRDLFREGDTAFRRRNVQKLVFFHMNGYPTDFGQIECLKLAASQNFKDKRVGYLGLTVLLDENQELLMLITNALKMDLNSNETMVIGLALSVLANVSSAEMLRDLEPEVSRLLDHRDPYVVKKAVLVTDRIVRKVPDLTEFFIHKTAALLAKDGHASVYQTVCCLIEAICLSDPSVIPNLRKLCSDPLGAILMNTCERGSGDPETVLHGVPNPFLISKCIQALRILTGNEPTAVRNLCTLLTTVVQLIEPTKVAGVSILYEVVITCTTLDVEDTMTQTVLKLLGTFLQHKDHNVKYVALRELRAMVAVNPAGVKKHLTTVVGCLKHTDISIRTRAVDLLYTMADAENASSIIQELIHYLWNCAAEEQPRLCSKIAALAETFQRELSDKASVYIQMLLAADVRVPDRLVALFIALLSVSDTRTRVSTVEALHAKCIAPPLGALRDRKPRCERLAVSLVGEYGNVWMNNAKSSDTDSLVPLSMFSNSTRALELGNSGRSPDFRTLLGQIVRLVEASDEFTVGTYDIDDDWGRLRMAELISIRHVGLLTVAKLIARSPNEGAENMLASREVLAPYRSHPDVETQQRACEYSVLLTSEKAELRAKVLAPMPAYNYEDRRTKFLGDMRRESKSMRRGEGVLSRSGGGVIGARGGSTGVSLINLLDDEFASNQVVSSGVPPNRANDLLADLFGLEGTGSAQAPGAAHGSSEFAALTLGGGDVSTGKAARGSGVGGFDLLSIAGTEAPAQNPVNAAENSGLDLLSGFGAPSPLPMGTNGTSQTQPSSSQDALADILGDFGGAEARSTAVPVNQPPQTAAGNREGLLDSKKAPAAAVIVSSSSSRVDHVVVQKPGLRAVMSFSRTDAADTVQSLFTITNESASEVPHFVLQVAVPKYIALVIEPPSETSIPRGSQAHQRFTLTNRMVGENKPFQLRFRIELAEINPQRDMAASNGLDPLARDSLDSVPSVPSAQLVLLEELQAGQPCAREGKHVRVVGVILELNTNVRAHSSGDGGPGPVVFVLGEPLVSSTGSSVLVHCVMRVAPPQLELKRGDRVEVLGQVVPANAQRRLGYEDSELVEIDVRVCRSVRGLDMPLHHHSINALRNFLTRQGIESLHHDAP